MTLTNEPTSPVEGVPPWAQESLLQWLTPILEARQENKYYYHDGAPMPAFALLAERRPHITLLWSYGTKGAIDDLVRQVRSDEALFLRVLDLAIENVHLGYSDGWADVELVRLNTLLTEAGSAWQLHLQWVKTDEVAGAADRLSGTLQRRVTAETAEALSAMRQNAPDAAGHLASAWNHAYGRSPDPGRAYSEAIKAVEAAAIPIVSPNNAKATLGTVIGDLRSTPLSAIEVVTNMAALVWANQTDRHAPVEAIEQGQAEMAVHVALALVHVFTQSIRVVL